MKVLCWILILFSLFSNNAYAIAPINSGIIKQAQEYGVSHVNDSLITFLQPWISYEERATKLNETSERAYLYTTFLLLATDAREKKANGKVVSISDSEQIITDYSGTLSFSVTLFGKDSSFSRNTTAVLRQGKSKIKAYQITAPNEAEKCDWLNSKLYTAQCYFYFDEREIDISKPVVLSVLAHDKQERKFYFDLGNIK
ncbi:hypothetical protein [Dendrosporobacter sp. 1207_IL3150]|uniref:hypothetical protein n=1 Tax=Dendrosporobacter sp. 1207_IL3150 TaxID=3084054 RepID=UPI002FD8C1B2